MANLFASSKVRVALWLCLFLLALQACTKQQTSAPPQAAEQPKAAPAETPIDATLLERLKNEQWTGDLDKMRERRYIRALVLYNKTNFFYDGPQPRGLTYEALKEFEKFLNTRLNTGGQPIHLVFLPVSQKDGIERMRDGRGDIAVSNI